MTAGDPTMAQGKQGAIIPSEERMRSKQPHMTKGRVLVTGGAGFIGSHLVDRLVELGYSVAVVDDGRSGRVENVNPSARFYDVDICSSSLEEVFEQERPDFVDHHAAQISVQSSVRDPVNDARINILGSLNLLEKCRAHGVRKVLFSSSGGAIYGEPEYRPCDEKHPARPVSPYGAAKLAVETYLFYYGKVYGLDFTCLRYANVYGPRQDPHGEAGVVAIFVQAMLEGRRPVIFGDGEQERDYVYVADIVEANVAALQKGSGGVYNIGTGSGTSVNEIFRQLSRIIGYDEAPKHAPSRPGDVYRISLDVSKARRELGWTPATSLEEGLCLTAEFFKSLQG